MRGSIEFLQQNINQWEIEIGDKKLSVELYDGLLNDVSITLIDKTDTAYPNKNENYWMITFKTFAPEMSTVEASLKRFHLG